MSETDDVSRAVELLSKHGLLFKDGQLVSTGADRDDSRTVSAGLMDALDRASKYSEPLTLDCSAAADIYGNIRRLRLLIEEKDKALEPFATFASMPHWEGVADDHCIIGPVVFGHFRRAREARGKT